MATISSQLRALRKQVNIPYIIKYVDRYIPPEEWEDKVIYIHITV
jgi:hypothetical protein